MKKQNLENVKKELRGKRGLALDIDDTLAAVRLFWFEEKIRLFGNPENLPAKKLIEKYGYTYNVPHWRTKEVERWVNEMFSSPDYWENLPLIEGANEAVKKINAIVPILCYLTARPIYATVSTETWLKKHGFLKRPVLANPDFEYMNSNKWKGRTLAALYPEIQGIIDDNPEIIENLPPDYPGSVYLYGEYIKDNAPKTNIRIIPCRTWDDALREITNEHGTH